MKFKTTDKEMRKTNVYSVPYCSGYNLLRYASTIAYACNKYGWKYDVYDIGHGVYITTGYKPVGKILPHYEEFDVLASKLDRVMNEELIDTIAFCLAGHRKFEDSWLKEYI